MCLCVALQDSKSGPILARFMDYYSLFWGPGVISTVNQPRGEFMCGSSTLTVLADSGSFLGLLLCFGSLCDFHMIDEHRGAFMCRSSTLTV